MCKNISVIIRTVVFLLLGLIFSCGANNNENTTNKQSIMVFAAASLTDVLTEIVDSFEVKHNVHVKMNVASSGTLARQIEQGANVDVYISASKKWTDYVDSLGFISKGNNVDVAKNALVLVAPSNTQLSAMELDSTLNLTLLLKGERLSIGNPTHVPAGKYAKQALEYFGWYDQMLKKILPAKDVRSALMVVEMAETPLGIVYRTDAEKSTKVKMLASFPERSHKPIVYAAGLCSDSQVAKKFFVFLNANATKNIWEKYGFQK